MEKRSVLRFCPPPALEMHLFVFCSVLPPLAEQSGAVPHLEQRLFTRRLSQAGRQAGRCWIWMITGEGDWLHHSCSVTSSTRKQMAPETWLAPIITSDIFIRLLLGTVSVLSASSVPGRASLLWQIVDIPTVACLDMAVAGDEQNNGQPGK